METQITERTPVEFELEITANSDALDPRIERAMRKLRGGITMKGFRPGKVPLSLVKRLYGKEITREVVDEVIQETYEAEVLEGEAYSVLGPPTVTTIDYEPFGDLRAVVEFGVRPEVELVNLAEHEVLRLTHEVAEEDVEEEVERLRDARAEMVPHEDPAGEEDVVYVDLQRLDLQAGVPIVGESEKIEDVPVYLGNENTVAELKAALTGRSVGDVTQAVLPPPDDQPEEGEPIEARRYEITVQDVKRRELPDLDDELAEDVSQGKHTTVGSLRGEIRRQMETQWRQQLRSDLENRLTEKMLELHPVPVPASSTTLFLDAFVADLKRQYKDKLPENFDEEAYRQEKYETAEGMVRWMVIRDRFMEHAGIEISEEDIEAQLEEMGSEKGLGADLMCRVVEAYDPNGIENVEKQVLDRKVYDALAGAFTVVDKTWDAYLEEQKEEAEQKEEEAQNVVEED